MEWCKIHHIDYLVCNVIPATYIVKVVISCAKFIINCIITTIHKMNGQVSYMKCKGEVGVEMGRSIECVDHCPSSIIRHIHIYVEWLFRVSSIIEMCIYFPILIYSIFQYIYMVLVYSNLLQLCLVTHILIFCRVSTPVMIWLASKKEGLWYNLERYQ